MRKLALNLSPFRLRALHVAFAALLLVTFPFQQTLEAAGGATLPSGGAFTAGSGTIANSANTVTIHQATNRGVIDWRSFSIGAGGSVLFQNGSGATLNRVTGSQMSLILGSLQATGTVYLINPQGVIIGPKGRVKTGGDFVASSLNVPNSLFLSGGALVFDGKSQGFVKNLGSISSTGGSVFLIASKVTNTGTISAPRGSVGMAAGEQVLLADSGSDQRIFVSAGTGDVTNKGTIAAAQAELKANGGNIYALAGNNGDEIRATGTATRDGHVWLVSNNGTTKVTGSISAQNVDGNGGSIETSGHTVDIGNTSIKTGAGGSWLVDPVDLTIDSSAASTIQTSLNGGTNVTESTDASGSGGSGTTASGNGDINVASSIAWNSAASLTLSAYRSITVQNGVSISNAGSGNLTLHADNASTGNGTIALLGISPIHFTGSGNVDLFYHPGSYSTPTNYSSSVTMGTGKLTQYMTVDTATDLQNINSNLSGTYALNTDVDASSIPNFTPIAHSANVFDDTQGFRGLFDGQGHTIDHLTVNDSTDLTAGLFAQTSSSGIIRNLGIKNAAVTSTFSGAAVGGLVGENYGSISASYVTGSVAGNGGGNTGVGGLVGENDGTISNTYSSASVSAITTSGCSYCVWIGGLVGENGLINYNTATISNSLAVGPVTISGSGTATIGGFVGENDAIINSSYFDNQSTGQSIGDNFCNICISDGIAGEATATLKNGSLPSGFSSSIWRASAGAYPKFTWEPIPGLPVSGTVYNGTTPLGSVTVVGLANGISFGSTTTNGSGAYTLTAPSGTTSVLTYLTGGYTGNTFSDNGTAAFTGVDIYTNALRLINTTNNNYSGMISALSAALGGNSGSNFLFSISGGNLTLGSGANFAVISSVATNIDQSIAGTGTVLVQSSGNLTINASKAISATGSGTPLTLVTGGKFINNAGVNALSTSGGGRWLVYSQNPGNDTVGSLSYGFKQYNATYGSTAVAQSTGNGLLYTVAPSLTPSLIGTASKTYDATTTSAVATANLTSTGGFTGDTITLSATGATYADKNQGSSKSVTATGVSVTSATDSTGATVYGYQLSSTSASGNIGIINPALLTYTANTASRTYGAANSAFSGTVTGFASGDTQASATTGTLSFSTPATTASNVGSYAINGSGLTAAGGNYTLAQAAGNATALTISPAVLTYTANSASRTYGTANSSFSGTVSGFVNGDTQPSATTGALSFTSPATTASNIGNYAIVGSGLTANNGNYTFEQAVGNNTALTINPTVLTYTADAASRSYGSANPAFTGTVTGFMNGETLASATAGTLSFTSPATTASNIGTYSISGSGLTANNGNYTFQQAAGNAIALTINPAQLLYTANPVSRTYGDANPALSGTITGFVNGDTQASATTGTLGFSSGATAASNVGSYAINGSGLTALSGNYMLAQAPSNATALTINPAQLTASLLASDKVYDATPSATGQVANLSGVLNGDDVSINASNATFRFNDKNVGNGKTVSEAGATLNGLAASNYTLTVTPGTANITPATVAAAVSANDNLYDTTTDASGRIGALSGILGNDDVQADSSHAMFAFSDKNVATNKSVFASGVTLTGADAGNYMLAVANGSAAITPATVTALVAANSKTYDGAPTATGSLGSLTGLLGHDTVTLNSANATYAFFNPNSGTGKAVSATGATLAGPDAGNYRLSIQNGFADINPVPVTVSIANANRLVGAPNPVFAAVYNGGRVPGISIPDLLSSISFSVNATAASGPGTYSIIGASTYPNVNLTMVPGTLTVNFASTPQVDPSMASAKRIDPPPLSAAALGNIFPTGSFGLLQVSFSTSWSSPGNSGNLSQPLASSSFLTSGASSATYQGGIRPW